MEFASGDMYTYVYLPLLIFFARMIDVTLMTLRIICPGALPGTAFRGGVHLIAKVSADRRR
jgi:hypothetical protein